MENLKIYIGQNNAPTQNEAFDCLLFLGYTWRGTRDYITQRNFDAMYADDEGIKVDSSISLSMFNQLNTEYRAVTIEELRAMLVMQRKSKDDANHTDQDGWLWWVDGDVSLVWKFGNPEQADRWDKESLDHVDLKPIQKPQDQQPIREYLDTKFHCLRYVADGTKKPDSFVLVPEGADCAFLYDKDTELEVVEFYKENCRYFYSNSKQEWMRLAGSLPHKKNVCVKIWQRNPQPEAPKLHPNTEQLVYLFAEALRKKLLKAQEKYGYTDTWMHGDWETDCRWQLMEHVRKGDPLDVAAYAAFCWHHGWSTEPLEAEFEALALAEESAPVYRAVPRDPSNPHSDYVVDPQPDFELPDTVYQYSASINTPRGTVHYDGVITFPGRITGIEDYHKVRAEIAKDGNTTPNQVNVHSLNIVG